jgi:hypothetical protein
MQRLALRSFAFIPDPDSYRDVSFVPLREKKSRQFERRFLLFKPAILKRLQQFFKIQFAFNGFKIIKDY